MGIFESLLCLLGCTLLQAYANPPPERPHLVFFIADDLGWGDVSFHGSKQIPTPNVDALARDGIILNQYYTQAVCSPSRGSLMTAKYPIRIGFQHSVIQAEYPWGLPLGEKIWPQYMKDLGYSTHAVGKWHLGFFQDDYLPQNRGFDSFFGFYNGVEDFFTHVSNTGNNMSGLDLHENCQNVWDYNGTYGTELFTEKAKEIIREHNTTKPLFLYFAQQAVHGGNFMSTPESPAILLQAPEKYVDPMIGIEDVKRKIFAGMVSAMDDSVGEIFDALYQSGMLEDTIFVFTSDNGGVPQEQLTGTSGSNWPLKGSKGNLWEGGVRGVSFIWSPFLRHQSRIYNELMHISDWLPTILSAVGGPDALKMLPNDIDGMDQWPSLVHALPSPRQDILLNLDDEGGVSGFRTARYKLVNGSTKGGKHDKWYDEEGISEFNINSWPPTPYQKSLYEQNYMRFLKNSKAASILLDLYGKDPILASHCHAPGCEEQLEVNCGPCPPEATCNATEEPCLYDIMRDPCEFYNIAELVPGVVTKMLQSIDKYRQFAIAPGEMPPDNNADPKLRDYAWVPWK